MLFRRTASHGTALVIPTRVGRTLDRLLTVLSPRKLVRRNIGHLRAYRRHADRLFNSRFPSLRAMAVTGGRNLLRESRIMTPFPVRRGERGFTGGDDGSGRRKQGGTYFSVGNAAVSGDRRHKGGAGGRNGRGDTKGVLGVLRHG